MPVCFNDNVVEVVRLLCLTQIGLALLICSTIVWITRGGLRDVQHRAQEGL